MTNQDGIRQLFSLLLTSYHIKLVSLSLQGILEFGKLVEPN